MIDPPMPNVSTRSEMSTYRVHWLFASGLLYIVIAGTMGHLSPIFIRVGMLVGLLLAFLSWRAWQKSGVTIPTEVKLLALFALWSLATGPLVCVDMSEFLQGAKRMCYILGTLTVVSIFAASRRTPAMGFLAVASLGIILFAGLMSTGGLNFLQDMAAEGSELYNKRQLSWTDNENVLGVYSVWSLAGFAFFWGPRKGGWLRWMLVLLVPLLLYNVIASGSRKAVLMVFVLATGWLVFCYGKFLLLRFRFLLLCGAVVAALVAGGLFVVKHTFVGERLRQATSSEERDNSTEMRLLMYEYGLALLLAHPVQGVGLRQYGVRLFEVTGGYSHSEYVEVFCNTGLVGGGLYFSAFVVCAARLWRVHRRSRDFDQRYAAGMCLAFFLTYAAAGFAMVIYHNLVFWLVAGSIMGYASAAEQKLIRPAAGSRYLQRSPRGSDSRLRWAVLRPPLGSLPPDR